MLFDLFNLQFFQQSHITELKKYKIEIKSRRLRLQIIDFFDITSFIFKEIQEDNPSENIVMVEEKLDALDRDGIGKLHDLLRLVFIN